ncbi:hypothetical protein G9A89_019719 [Geosiphon pyriformis]|nr:hypothetical protein G9A89_019719 [Geosiphon pyriformis]
MALVKIEKVLPKKIRTIKNNLPEPIKLDWDPEPVINLLDPKQFHEHYQGLVPTREEQEQCLEQLNTQLCQYCLIPCDFQYCNECDLIYNSPIHIIYTIPKEKEPISSCALELESNFNSDLNSDNNNDKNNSSSFVPYNNNNDNNLNLDSNSNLNHEQYIALPNLTKEQELKWFSNNNEGIMSEHVHNTDVGKQKKAKLLGPYNMYFEGFNLRSSMPSGLQSPLPPPDFGISDPWKVTESEKEEEEEAEDQEFTYQNLITENPEFETLNLQTQQNLN